MYGDSHRTMPRQPPVRHARQREPEGRSPARSAAKRERSETRGGRITGGGGRGGVTRSRTRQAVVRHATPPPWQRAPRSDSSSILRSPGRGTGRCAAQVGVCGASECWAGDLVWLDQNPPAQPPVIIPPRPSLRSGLAAHSRRASPFRLALPRMSSGWLLVHGAVRVAVHRGAKKRARGRRGRKKCQSA